MASLKMKSSKHTNTSSSSSVVLASTLALFALASAYASLVSALDFHALIGRPLAFLLNQQYADGKDLPEVFRSYAMADRSNEDIGYASAQEIIERSGYNYENHYVISDDGYITQLVRLINPLADRSLLKQPPVLLQQGGITDITIWLFASPIQHHPEKYPRTPKDGPITSWNRSIAFMLANNGYDVWLAPTRGRNANNLGHIKIKETSRVSHMLHESANSSAWSELDALHSKTQFSGLIDTIRYWDYTMDDIAAFEVPKQMDKVLEVTGAAKLTLMPMSFSTIHSMLALSRRPHYQRKIHNAVVWAPIVNNKGTNTFLFAAHNTLCKWVPSELGTLVFTELWTSQLTRNFNLLFGLNKELRYSIVMNMLIMLAGPSAPFQTLLDPGVYGHVPMATGFKEVQQYCQIVTAAKFQHYDYGLIRNKKLYNSIFPPLYRTDKVDFGGNWMLISGEHDIMATQDSVRQYMATVRSKPFEHIFVRGYNHLDLWAAIDNDIRINLPVLGYLDNFHLPPLEGSSSGGGGGGDRENSIGGTGGVLPHARSLKTSWPLNTTATTGTTDTTGTTVEEIPAEKPELKKVITQEMKRSLAEHHGLPPSARAMREPASLSTSSAASSATLQATTLTSDELSTRAD